MESNPPVNKHSNGKSPSWIGNTYSNGGFSIAMLDYRSVRDFFFVASWCFWRKFLEKTDVPWSGSELQRWGGDGTGGNRWWPGGRWHGPAVELRRWEKCHFFFQRKSGTILRPRSSFFLMKSLKRHFCWELVFWKIIVWWRGEGDWVLILTWNLCLCLFYGLLFAAGAVPRTNSPLIFRESSKGQFPPKWSRNLYPKCQKIRVRNYRTICAECLSWQFFRDVNLVVLYIRSTSSSWLEQWPVEAGYLLRVGDYYYSVLQGLRQYKDPIMKQSGFCLLSQGVLFAHAAQSFNHPNWVKSKGTSARR